MNDLTDNCKMETKDIVLVEGMKTCPISGGCNNELLMKKEEWRFAIQSDEWEEKVQIAYSMLKPCLTW